MYSKGLNCKNNNMNIGNHFIIILSAYTDVLSFFFNFNPFLDYACVSISSEVPWSEKIITFIL